MLLGVAGAKILSVDEFHFSSQVCIIFGRYCPFVSKPKASNHLLVGGENYIGSMPSLMQYCVCVTITFRCCHHLGPGIVKLS